MNSDDIKPSSSSSPNTLPPIAALLKESWETFKKSILSIFILNVLAIVVNCVLVVIWLGVSIASGVMPFIFSLAKGSSNPADLISKLNIPLLIADCIILWIILMIIATVVNTALILIIDKKGESISFPDIIRKAFNLIVPLSVASLPATIIIIGGFFVFIFPALLFSFLLMFGAYEVIFADKRWTSALKRSVFIMSSHFSDIFVRMLVIFGINIVFSAMVFSISLGLSFIPIIGQIMTFGVTIFSTVVGWFGLIYVITLYKQARAKTDPNKESSLLWMWIVAIIGWVICLIVLFATYKLVSSGLLNNLLKQGQKGQAVSQNSIYVPSSCGLSLLKPETTDIYQGKTRKWILDEFTVGKESFYVLDQSVFPVKNAQVSYFRYKAVKNNTDDKEIFIPYPGIGILCADNTRALSLKEYEALILSNKNVKVSKNKHFKAGEVSAVTLTIEGKHNGQSFQDPAYLILSGDRKKLIYMVLWRTSKDDPKDKQVWDDIWSIIYNLKPRASSNVPLEELNNTQLQPKQNTNYAPSCTSYNIREGEFTSNKCYAQKDYDDLIYYLNRFNNAVFDYNAAVSNMKIVCSGSDFFKNSCAEDKAKKAKAEQDINTYRATINGIIAKGK